MERMEFSRKNVRIAVGRAKCGETVIFTVEGHPRSVLMPHAEYLKLLAESKMHVSLIEEATVCALPNIDKCPQCNGPADNGHDRCVPPNPYNCTKCELPKGE